MIHMIKEALKYIVDLGEAKEHEIHGDTYSDKPLYRIDEYIPMADDEIRMNTLTSLVDYIKGHIDTMSDRMLIHVVDPETVRLYSQLNDNRKREHLVTVRANVPSFPFGEFIDKESFCINVQSKFIDNAGGTSSVKSDKELILQFAGTVESGTVAEYGDDGVSQKATVKTGIASKSDAVVPNPVTLKPFRTFLEVDQPKSDFIFRMKQDKFSGVTCALFEADGGAWKMEATKSIKEYLQHELADEQIFTVIS